MLERVVREIRRRTRVVGSFPDGRSALMLAAGRLRYISGGRWRIPAQGTQHLDVIALGPPLRVCSPDEICANLDHLDLPLSRLTESPIWVFLAGDSR